MEYSLTSMDGHYTSQILQWMAFKNDRPTAIITIMLMWEM